MVALNPKKDKSTAIRILQEQMGLSQEEAMSMLQAGQSGELNALREDRQQPQRMDVLLEREQEIADAHNDHTNVPPPEEAVREDVPINELDIAKQIFANANSDDFKSVDSPAGQAITLEAKAHPELAKHDAGYDTWLVIRGPLVTKTKNELVVGMGRVIVITQPG